MNIERDYYQVLEVSRDADQKTIKRAFLKKARQLHPDVSGDPEAEEKFKEVNEAYSVLSDETRRANYDRFGTADPQGIPMDDLFGGMGDILSSIFGGGAARTSSSRRPSGQGRHMSMSAEISLEQAATGVKKTFRYRHMAACKTCEGKGFTEGGKVEACQRCDGTGMVTEVHQTPFGYMQQQSVCPECQGTGTTVSNPCPDCHGEGRHMAEDTIEVDIPAGVYDGQEIRIPGAGEAGLRGAPAGDLLVSVQVVQNDTFERRGDDLLCVKSVDALDAILGVSFQMDGIIPDEVVQVEVPAGSSYGQQVRISGFGMPNPTTQIRGDLIVFIEVTIPDDLTASQLKTLQKLQDGRKNPKAARHFGGTKTKKSAAKQKPAAKNKADQAKSAKA